MKDTSQLDLDYLMFETIKRPDELAKRLRDFVQKQKLGDRIFRFCIQKGANRREGYWAFLAVKPDEPLPELFYHFLKDFGVTLKKERLREKDVSKMLSHRYISLEKPDPVLQYSKPNKKFDMSFGTEVFHDSFQSTKFNQLLYWLSACASGNWNTFKSLCLNLELAMSSSEARYLMRALYLLGHIELSHDGSKWEIAPSAWVQNDTEDDWFLAGARSASDRDKLHIHAQANGPERLSHPLKKKLDPNLAEIAGPIARELALHLPTMNLWKHSLATKSMDQAVNYSFEKWNGTDFTSLDHHTISESGLYRVTPNSQRFVKQYFLYYDADTQKWLQSDWSGLRLLADVENDVPIEWVWISSDNCLYIREDQRLPLIYEKALVLASGLLPVKKNAWLCYSGISHTLVNFIAQLIPAHVREEKYYV